MAELSKDMVLRLAFAKVNDGDRRMLQRLLSGMDGISGFELADDGTLVVSLSMVGGDEDLSRALAAAGMFPVSTEHLGASFKGGFNAC